MIFKSKEKINKIPIGIKVVSIIPNDIVGLNEFADSLKKEYIVEQTSEYAPACGSGSEIELIITIKEAFNIFLNNNESLSGCLGNTIFPLIIGWILPNPFAWLCKKIKSLRKKNENLEIGQLRFRFNDIEIVVSGQILHDETEMNRIMHQIRDSFPVLSHNGLQNITSIEMPYVESEENTIVQPEPYIWIKDYWWKINYSDNNTSCFYHFKTKAISQ